MRTPAWESSAGALAALLGSVAPDQLGMADLHTITLTSGAVLRWTSLDQSITVGSRTFLSGAGVPVIERERTKLSVGVAVDSMSVRLGVDDSLTYGGQPLAAAARGGLFMGATWVLERVFFPAASWQPVGTIVLFAGRVAEQRPSRTQIALTIASHLELLDAMVPAEVFQPGCRNTLYDGNCGVNRAARAQAVVATSNGDAPGTGFTADMGATSGQSEKFWMGVATCTSGANAGVSRTIRSLSLVAGTTWTVDVIAPWPLPVTVGDAFTLYQGCDKTVATCRDKFANLSRFRGEPWIPVAETVT